MSDENEIFIPPYFHLFDRLDGIGELSCFQQIVATVESPYKFQPEKYYTYDQTLETYIQTQEHINFESIPCFPGTFQSNHPILKNFNGQYIENIEHLVSFVQSFPTDLLAKKPKGSVFDVFSQSEKFLVTQDFNIDILKNGKDFSPAIKENFNHFSQLFFDFQQQYKEINIEFISHEYHSEHIVFSYQINKKYRLHIAFTKDNTFILGEINKKSDIKMLHELHCDNYNYESIFQTIIEKLKICSNTVSIKIQYDKLLTKNIPLKKNLFFNQLFNNNLEEFVAEINNSSFFIVHRKFNTSIKNSFKCNIKREIFNNLSFYANYFDVKIDDFINIFINFYFFKQQN